MRISDCSSDVCSSDLHVPFWVVLSCQTAMALGMLFGGWRIVNIMGSKITRLTPHLGFCAEMGGALTLFGATWLGVPVETNNTLTGAIIDVGAARTRTVVCGNRDNRIVAIWGVMHPS